MDAAKGIVGPGTARQCRPLGATMERRNPAKPGRIEGQVFLVPFGTTAKRNSPGRAKPSPARRLGKQQSTRAAGKKDQTNNCRVTPTHAQPDTCPKKKPVTRTGFLTAAV